MTRHYVDQRVCRPELRMMLPWLHGDRPLATECLTTALLTPSVGTTDVTVGSGDSSSTSKTSAKQRVQELAARLNTEGTNKEGLMVAVQNLLARIAELEEANAQSENARIEMTIRYNAAVRVMPDTMRAAVAEAVDRDLEWLSLHRQRPAHPDDGNEVDVCDSDHGSNDDDTDGESQEDDSDHYST